MGTSGHSTTTWRHDAAQASGGPEPGPGGGQSNGVTEVTEPRGRTVGTGLGVGRGVGVGLAVGIGEGVGVAVGMLEGAEVGVGVGAGIGVGGGIAVRVGAGGRGVGVRVGVGVGVGMDEGVGSGLVQAATSNKQIARADSQYRTVVTGNFA